MEFVENIQKIDEKKKKKEIKTKMELISQGSYGCIFHPGMNCDGKRENIKYITKIQKDKNATENELEIGKLIKKTRPYISYFAPILESCSIFLADINPEVIQKCNIIKINPDLKNEPETYYSNKIRYVGKDTLEKYLLSRLHNDYKSFIPKLFETHLYLLKAIQKLEILKIVHYDLKENNILYDPEKNVPIIIDFGLSIPMDNLQYPKNYEKSFYTYYKKYPPWCLEISLISYIVQELYEPKKPKSENQSNWPTQKIDVSKLHEEIDIFFQENFIIPLLLKIPGGEKQIKQACIHWKRFITENCTGQKGSKIVELLAQSWKSWDNYSLSVIYLFILESSNTLPSEQNHSKCIQEYYNVLVSCILSIPSKRENSLKMKNKIEDISKNINIVDYNDVLIPYLNKNKQEDVYQENWKTYKSRKDQNIEFEKKIYN